MKLRYLFALSSVFCLSSAHAEIFKRVDADGHVTYSSTPLKGAKKLYLEPLPTMPAPPPQRARSEAAADFPRVDAATQKGRDNTRRQILEDELATEEKALLEARKNLQEGAENPETYTSSDGKVYRNVAKQDEKMSGLQDQVHLHEKNISALKTELANRSK